MTARQHPDAMRLLALRLLVLTVAVGAVFLLLASVGSAEEPAAPTVEYVVAPGDSLWAIASGLVAPGEDVRDMVRTIISINDLPGGSIQAGMALQLPGE